MFAFEQFCWWISGPWFMGEFRFNGSLTIVCGTLACPVTRTVYAAPSRAYSNMEVTHVAVCPHTVPHHNTVVYDLVPQIGYCDFSLVEAATNTILLTWGCSLDCRFDCGIILGLFAHNYLEDSSFASCSTFQLDSLGVLFHHSLQNPWPPRSPGLDWHPCQLLHLHPPQFACQWSLSLELLYPYQPITVRPPPLSSCIHCYPVSSAVTGTGYWLVLSIV